MGEGGFEPPKSLTTDLQSAPFGHSGIPPYLIRSPVPSERKPAKRLREEKDEQRSERAFALARKRAMRSLRGRGAGGRTRTPDLLITNQLLYQLSYTSVGSRCRSPHSTPILADAEPLVKGKF